MRRFALLWFGFWLFLAPSLAPHDPLSTSRQQLAPPSTMHWLGTDYLGRDLASRLLHGGTRSLSLALSASFLTTLTGTAYALLLLASARFATWGLLLLDALLALPTLVLALVLLTLFGATTPSLIFALGVAQFASFARFAYTVALVPSRSDYAHAAYAFGATRWYILRQHVWRSIHPQLQAYAVAIFGYALINASALGFLGFSPPAIPDWGTLLAEGRTALQASVWLTLAPATCMFISISLLNARSQA